MFMIAALLQAFLFAQPVTSAYAAEVNDDVIVSVTFANERPSRVCTSLYELDDADFGRALDTHCWVPKTDICSMDVWEKTRIDDGNFKVVVMYRNRPDDTVYLVMKVNT
jgi:hypothetical protein